MRIFSKLLPAARLKLIISCIGVMALVVFSGVVVYEMTKVEVVFAENGENQKFKTHANTVQDLLDELGISVGEYDELSHNLNAGLKDGMKINYETAKKVVVTIDGKEEIYYTVKPTVEKFFEEHNLSFSNRDQVTHQLKDEIADGMNINVTKAFQVTIMDGKKKKKVWTTGGTVADILSIGDITYNKKSKDKINLSLEQKVADSKTIKITRVSEKTIEEKEELPFETVKQNDPNLDKGKEKVVEEGKNGLITKIYKITKENGKEVDRKLIDEKVEDSKDRVIAIGTKKAPVKKAVSKPKSKPASQPKSGKVFYMTASAYTASCNGCSGFTSTGINLKANPHMKVVAVDPSVIPLGTKLWVEGYGNAVAGDTGGSIRGHRVDLHFPTKSAAYQFGRKQVKVKIID